MRFQQYLNLLVPCWQLIDQICNSIVRQPIELEMCSNPLRIR